MATENVVIHVKVSPHLKLVNFEKPQPHHVRNDSFASRFSPKSRTNDGAVTAVDHFHIQRRARTEVFKKLSTPTAKTVSSSTTSTLILKENTVRKPLPPNKGERKHLPPAHRVASKLSEYRTDQAKAQALRDRLGKIEKLKKQNAMFYSNGKNCVVHNKLLSRNGSYSAKTKLKKLMQNSNKREKAIVNASIARLRCREKKLEKVEILATANLRFKRAREKQLSHERRIRSLASSIALAARTASMCEHLDECRFLRKAKLQKIMSCRKIQRWYRKHYAIRQNYDHDRFIKKMAASRVIARYLRKYYLPKKSVAKETSALLLRKFLEDLQCESSSFTKLVKRYRYKAICVQRNWQTFKAITKARMKILNKLWDRREKEVIHLVYERRKRRMEKSLLAQKQAMTEDLELWRRERSSAIPTAETRADQKALLQKKENGIREKKLNLPPETIQQLMVEALNKSSRRPGPGEIGAETRGPKSMRVDKKVRQELLADFLRKKRIKFRKDIPNLKKKERARLLKKTRFNEDNVKLLIRDKKNITSNGMLGKKIGSARDQDDVIRRVLHLYIYSTIRPGDIDLLIEQGIDITEQGYEKVAKDPISDPFQLQTKDAASVVPSSKSVAMDAYIKTIVMDLVSTLQLSTVVVKKYVAANDTEENVLNIALPVNNDVENTVASADCDDSRSFPAGKKNMHPAAKTLPTKRRILVDRKKSNFLTGDEVFKVFVFDLRYGWIRASDREKYATGKLTRKFEYGLIESHDHEGGATLSNDEKLTSQSASNFVSGTLKSALLKVSATTSVAESLVLGIIKETLFKICE